MVTTTVALKDVSYGGWSIVRVRLALIVKLEDVGWADLARLLPQ